MRADVIYLVPSASFMYIGHPFRAFLLILCRLPTSQKPFLSQYVINIKWKTSLKKTDENTGNSCTRESPINTSRWT